MVFSGCIMGTQSYHITADGGVGGGGGDRLVTGARCEPNWLGKQ